MGGRLSLWLGQLPCVLGGDSLHLLAAGRQRRLQKAMIVATCNRLRTWAHRKGQRESSLACWVGMRDQVVMRQDPTSRRVCRPTKQLSEAIAFWLVMEQRAPILQQPLHKTATLPDAGYVCCAHYLPQPCTCRMGTRRCW